LGHKKGQILKILIKNIQRMCRASGRFVWAISGVGRSNELVCSRAQEKKKKKQTPNGEFRACAATPPLNQL